MKRKIAWLLAAAAVVAWLTALPGCARPGPVSPDLGAAPAGTTQGAESQETLPPATTPPDGDPATAACKGSYTGTPDPETVVARAGEAELTAGLLQAYYWGEAAQWAAGTSPDQPDLTRPLDSQPCSLDPEIGTWQQFFLKRAISRWHTVQSLLEMSRTRQLPLEEAYQPADHLHEDYMTGMPAAEVLYGYQKTYQINSQHQTFLAEIPALLDRIAQAQGLADGGELAAASFGASRQDLESYVRQVNEGYMYLTSRSWDVEPTPEELTAFHDETAGQVEYPAGEVVTFRQILLVPENAQISQDCQVTAPEEQWAACQEGAEELVKQFRKIWQYRESDFAELANKNSADTGTANQGGLYRQIPQGVLPEALDSWCFDPARQPGDVEILRTEYGVHVLYFSGRTPAWYPEAETGLRQSLLQEVAQEARAALPLEIDYGSVVLGKASGAVAIEQLLYPDVAHERYPTVPLYLQQDYPDTMYGGDPIRSHGCGITTMAMLASYMTDRELTPPEMCQAFGSYSYHGTDGTLFNREPQGLGFFLEKKTYDAEEARQALQDGFLVVSIQHKGYWTRGGHYILVEKYNPEDDTYQVRDSNIYNYRRIASHAQDRHTWSSIRAAGSGFWIFQAKPVRTPACSRCGTPDAFTQAMLRQAYTCPRCQVALARRDFFLAAAGE